MLFELRNHMKLTMSIVLISVIFLMIVAAFFAEKLLTNTQYIPTSKTAIMADAYDAYLQREPSVTADSYRVGRSIINISYIEL
jgi:hypothetical protein